MAFRTGQLVRCIRSNEYFVGGDIVRIKKTGAGTVNGDMSVSIETLDGKHIGNPSWSDQGENGNDFVSLDFKALSDDS